MPRSRAKQGGGNSGITLRDASGKVVYDRYGRKKFAPRPPKEAHPWYARQKKRQLDAAKEAWAKERADRDDRKALAERHRAPIGTATKTVQMRPTGRGG